MTVDDFVVVFHGFYASTNETDWIHGNFLFLLLASLQVTHKMVSTTRKWWQNKTENQTNRKNWEIYKNKRKFSVTWTLDAMKYVDRRNIHEWRNITVKKKWRKITKQQHLVGPLNVLSKSSINSCYCMDHQPWLICCEIVRTLFPSLTDSFPLLIFLYVTFHSLPRSGCVQNDEINYFFRMHFWRWTEIDEIKQKVFFLNFTKKNWRLFASSRVPIRKQYVPNNDHFSFSWICCFVKFNGNSRRQFIEENFHFEKKKKKKVKRSHNTTNGISQY